MKKLAIGILSLVFAACSHVSADEATQIAYERLSAVTDGPSLQGEALRSSLAVTDDRNGMYLVEARDEQRNLLWAVIVHSSGESEISRMAIDG